jgi:cytochrome P450
VYPKNKQQSVFYLARNNTIQNRARAEVLSFPLSQSTDHLDRLSFVKNCLYESLRLRPSAPLRGRTATEQIQCSFSVVVVCFIVLLIVLT